MVAAFLVEDPDSDGFGRVPWSLGNQNKASSYWMRRFRDSYIIVSIPLLDTATGEYISVAQKSDDDHRCYAPASTAEPRKTGPTLDVSPLKPN